VPSNARPAGDGFDNAEQAPQRVATGWWVGRTRGVANVDAYGRRYIRLRPPPLGDAMVTNTCNFAIEVTLCYKGGRDGVYDCPPRPKGMRMETLAPGATTGAPGSLVPAVDPHGLYMWSVDYGGVGNLNSARLPVYARLDLRVTFNPKQMTGRWQVYFEVLNALNRNNVSALQPTLEYDPTSDRPRLVSGTDDGFPRLPSFGVRYRF
jgi:hypothetical protein